VTTRWRNLPEVDRTHNTLPHCGVRPHHWDWGQAGGKLQRKLEGGRGGETRASVAS